MKKALELSHRKLTPQFVETSPCQVYPKKIPDPQEADPEGQPVIETVSNVGKRRHFNEAAPEINKRKQRCVRQRHGLRRR